MRRILLVMCILLLAGCAEPVVPERLAIGDCVDGFCWMPVQEGVWRSAGSFESSVPVWVDGDVLAWALPDRRVAWLDLSHGTTGSLPEAGDAPDAIRMIDGTVFARVLAHTKAEANDAQWGWMWGWKAWQDRWVTRALPDDPRVERGNDGRLVLHREKVSQPLAHTDGWPVGDADATGAAWVVEQGSYDQAGSVWYARHGTPAAEISSPRSGVDQILTVDGAVAFTTHSCVGGRCHDGGMGNTTWIASDGSVLYDRLDDVFGTIAYVSDDHLVHGPRIIHRDGTISELPGSAVGVSEGRLIVQDDGTVWSAWLEDVL